MKQYDVNNEYFFSLRDILASLRNISLFFLITLTIPKMSYFLSRLGNGGVHMGNIFESAYCA